MRSFTDEELERMQAAQVAGMMDECVILEHVDGAIDDYGMPVEAWIERLTTACGYDGTAHDEVMEGTQVVITDGKLRLPIGTRIGNLDRVRITKRFEALMEEVMEFELIGEPREGPSGLVLNLRIRTVD